MPSLKEFRTRISTVKTTKQMTSAMKMVAAAKLRKAQQAIFEIKPYSIKLNNILSEMLASFTDEVRNPYFENRKTENVLIIVNTSNRGLCGSFNSSVEKMVLSVVENYKNNGVKIENISFFAFGKKGYEALIRRKFNVLNKSFDVFDNLTFENISKFAKTFSDLFLDKKFDKIEIVYNSFKNAANQELVCETLLPVAKKVSDNKSYRDFIYEPNFEDLINTLLPRTIAMTLFKTLLDSNASEHGARMTAMHKATDNAGDLLKQLTISYNKARQAAITKEILEIVGGAAALGG
jgi:F-type H+-transporting ATPase subunit gamma